MWNFVTDYEAAQLTKSPSYTPSSARYFALAVLVHFVRFLYITLLFGGGRRRRFNASIMACVVGAFAVTYALEYWSRQYDDRHPYIIGLEDLPWYLQRKVPQDVTEREAIWSYSFIRLTSFYMFNMLRF